VADRSTGDLWHPAAALPLLLIVAPYYLNKFVYLAYPGDYLVFLATDYTNKLLTLALLFLVARRHADAFAIPWRLVVPTGGAWRLTAAGLAVLIAGDVLGFPIVHWLTEHTYRLTTYPAADGHPVLAVIDDTLGCLLTGLSEEAIFRFYLINVLLWRGLATPLAVFASILIFAPIHWSYGIGSTAFAAFASIPITLNYLATRNLAVAMIMHAAYDAFYFTGAADAMRRLVW
jgi:membrane protease YdiL (CAAX protease family)